MKQTGFLALLGLVWLLFSPTPAAGAPTPAGWPLQPRPRIVHAFDLPAQPWLPGHRGVDLAGTPGQPVRAATAGRVTYAGPLAGRGVVVVSTGPLRTTYEPVIATVAVGTEVRLGQLLGHLSAAASHCAPAACLHWGLRRGEIYLDPLTLLPDSPVRLLPLTTTGPQRPSGPPPPHLTAPLPASSAGGPPAVMPAASGNPTAGGGPGAVVVGAAAILTIGTALMIRRH
ncbi:peptidase M23-like protein [Kribbella amoyensis]|uniref:Peptidase M23-like protein n=1 Tax=Kribbella amoyensis TaxID=996641 RepID=A0A561B0X0_9ACTN|nr:M23 family metallopeptidase [Kribbella amoyensis]TWD72482.1 peptidase M23-like protein [Kribbella amoyensis]